MLGDGTELGSGGRSWEVGLSDIPEAGTTDAEIPGICCSLSHSEPLQMRSGGERGFCTLSKVVGG